MQDMDGGSVVSVDQGIVQNVLDEIRAKYVRLSELSEAVWPRGDAQAFLTTHMPAYRYLFGMEDIYTAIQSNYGLALAGTHIIRGCQHGGLEVPAIVLSRLGERFGTAPNADKMLCNINGWMTAQKEPQKLR